MRPIHIKAIDIPDAWFQCVYNIFNDDCAYEYVIEKGSFESTVRREFFYATIEIEYAYQEPYDLMLPKAPAHLNIPDPVCEGYIEQYLPYLMSAEIDENEQYTYGSRLCGYEWLSTSIPIACYRSLQETIGEPVQPHTRFRFVDQIDHWITVLKKTPMTNQAVLQVAQPNDCKLSDPPCLRQIDLRILGGKLHFFPYFRSWDLWGGFPANLGAIAVLQKYMADYIGVRAGKIIASSKGLHLYDYIHELAQLRIGK